MGADANKNLTALLAAGFIKETVDGEDYLVLKSFKGRAVGTAANEQEFAIKASAIGGTKSGPGVPVTFCDVTLANNPPTLGPLVSHDILGTPISGDFPTGFATIVPGQIVFLRYTDGGAIFNPFAGELAFNFGVSPADTEWNSVFTDPSLNGFGDLSNVNARVYDIMYNAVNFGFGANIVGLPMIMRQISTGRLWAVTFSRWDSGGGAPFGGYAFDIQEIIADPTCRLTFSDGTFLDTAPISTLDRSLMPGVAFVAPGGNNTTGTVGDQNLPYQTFSLAIASADTVIALPGNYTETINLFDGKTVYAMPGATFSNGTINVASTAVKANWLGSAIFTSGHRGFKVSGLNAEVYFEFDKMDNNISFLEATVDCDINVSCNSILNTGASGFAGGGTIRNGANVNVSVKNFWHCNYRLIFFRAATAPYSGRFVVNCPDMRIISGGVFGNAAKVVFDMDQTDGAEFIFNGNLTNAHDALGSGSSRGCIGMVNQLFAPSKLTINGDMDGGPSNPTFFTGFRSYVGEVVINGDINADTYFPLQLLRNGGGPVAKDFFMSFNGSKITGAAACIIQSGKEIYFRDCSFYNSDTAEGVVNIDYATVNGADSEIYVYNGIAETGDFGGGVGSFLGGTPATIAILGCHNTVSADVLGIGAVDSFGGYAVLAGVKVPKI